MTTHNAYNCLDSQFCCFYTVICLPLRLGHGVTYNTSILYDDRFSTKGYSVNTMASILCDEYDPREGSSSLICQS